MSIEKTAKLMCFNVEEQLHHCQKDRFQPMACFKLMHSMEKCMFDVKSILTDLGYNEYPEHHSFIERKGLEILKRMWKMQNSDLVNYFL